MTYPRDYDHFVWLLLGLFFITERERGRASVQQSSPDVSPLPFFKSIKRSTLVSSIAWSVVDMVSACK